MNPNKHNKKMVDILRKSKKMSANKKEKLITTLPENIMNEGTGLFVMLSPLLKARTYKHAKDRLIALISSEKEKTAGKMPHDKYYYASQIARMYQGVDARKLAEMI
ncbi:hypothetical protein [Synechococcus phage BUCT-ZZ01]|nr:hypothetical protein [Synechococcus phage BUCT-ZZ01]